MEKQKENAPVILVYFYKVLEPGEYDETTEQINSFIDEQSQAYKEMLTSLIQSHKIIYRTDILERSIAHFKSLLGEAIQWSVPLEIWLYPQDRIAEYKIKEEIVHLSLFRICPWKDFILYGNLRVLSDTPNSLIRVSTSLSDMLAHFSVQTENIDFSLSNSGVFKDFLISSDLEISTNQNENLVVIGREYCF